MRTDSLADRTRSTLGCESIEHVVQVVTPVLWCPADAFGGRAAVQNTICGPPGGSRILVGANRPQRYAPLEQSPAERFILNRYAEVVPARDPCIRPMVNPVETFVSR